MTAAFDTLKYAKQLKQAGVPEDQAEIHAEALRGVIEEQIMARFDRIEDDLAGIKADILRLEGRFSGLEGKFNGLEERTKGRFTLLQWMIGFVLAIQAAILLMLIRA